MTWLARDTTHINTWEGPWDAVKRAIRPNLGICLDTFTIVGMMEARVDAALAQEGCWQE